MTDDSNGSVRQPARDEEADGLDCFATEAVGVIETADAAPAGLVRPEARLPTGDARPLGVQPRWLRELAIVFAVALSMLAATMLEFRSTPPAEPMNGRSAEPVEASREQAASPNPSVAAQPVAPLTIERASAADSRVDTPDRHVDVSRVAAPSPRSVSHEAPAAAPTSNEVAEAMVPTSAAADSTIATIAATPSDVRIEPAQDTARALAAPAVIVPPSDRSSIERVLEAYRDAYERLDAPSAAVIWPRVDTRALSRAFSTLAQQDVLFDSCDLDITGATAKARCVGEIRYVRRVGDQTPRVRRMSWSFTLERVSYRWQIARVSAD